MLFRYWNGVWNIKMCNFDNETWREGSCKRHSPTTMSEPGNEGYKYLGILEFDSILTEEMKKKIQETYFKRMKLLLKSKLNSRNLFLAINSWAVAVVRYAACIIQWNKEEIAEMERKTRKLLTIYGAFHPKSNVNRLYMKRKVGGRGLISIEECIEGTCTNTLPIVKKSSSNSLQTNSILMQNQLKIRIPSKKGLPARRSIT